MWPLWPFIGCMKRGDKMWCHQTDEIKNFYANLGGLGGQMLDISSEDEEDNISLRNSQYLNRPPDSQSQVASCFNKDF